MSTPGQADSGDCSFTLADVLEQEFRELGGEPAPETPWQFEPRHILRAEALRARLLGGRDATAAGLAGEELRAFVDELRRAGEPESPADVEALRARLAAAFNGLLEREDLYQEGAARFAPVRFRSITRERIAAGPVRSRNRLLLEDAFPEIERRDDARLAALYARVHRRKLGALCLSGGGIRSATFALGVVQGLSRVGLLRRFDYLSTVSGGGYLGAWLSAWMHRDGRDRVVAELAEPTGKPLAPEPAPLGHLRSYSAYLSPRVGLGSTDTWTLAAIYLRNLMLNWLVLVPLLAAALVVPQFMLALARLPHRDADRFSAPIDAMFVALGLVAVAGAALAMRYVYAAIEDPRRDHRAFVRGCFVPTLASVVALVVGWAWVAGGKVSIVALPGGPAAWRLSVALGEWGATLPAAWIWAGAGALVPLAGRLLARKSVVSRHLAVALVVGALGGLVVGAVMHGLVPSAPSRTAARLEQYAWYVSLAGPALIGVALSFAHLYIGATSRSQPDTTFEWSARCGAWLLAALFVWLAACAVVILAPLAVGAVLNRVSDTELVRYGQVIASVLGVGAGAVSLRVGYGARLHGEGSAGVRLAQAVALPIFVVALLAALSFLSGWLMDLPARLSPMYEDRSCPALTHPGQYYEAALRTVACGSLPSAFIVLLTLGAAGLCFSLLVDTNRFSLHGMYRARLIRTFLGASRPAHDREPNRFTGFDERDDIALAALRLRERSAPLHVVNVALNLVTGDELAAHHRKALSFTFSPLHSGAWGVGYRRTREYGGGVTLGTAITISGAAASPEMGYHSKPLLSFLLTLFNIRLGWWLGNPGHSGRHDFRNAAPTSSLMPILDEARGRTDDRNANVYLSDGGHFENLGLYEMVLRRCHWIVVSDAGCDPDCSFEDLGNAIRRIRMDFGIPITFERVPIYSRDPAHAGRPDAAYCALGRIRYSVVDGDVEDGTLVYLKPAFYGSEPPDVFNYARTSAAFPHESTANQFFTEAQFESYRRLGSYVVRDIAPGREQLTLEEFATRVETRLKASSGTPADRPGVSRAYAA